MSLDRSRQSGKGRRILIVGTGGQGVLTIARWLCDCFVGRGHDVVSGQLHGMAQRGGAVQASVILDGGISSVIPSRGADFVIGLEPVETARALSFMSPQSVVLMNTAPITPFVLAQRTVSKQDGANYPDVDGLVQSVRAVTEHVISFDATARAVEAGAGKALNMVMLGCLFAWGGLPCTADEFLASTTDRIPPALRDVNLRAYQRGVEFVSAMAEARTK